MRNKTERVCLCGRIIIDPKNKTGLCPKCEKTAENVLTFTSLAALGFWAKKYGPKVIKSVGNIIKSLKK